MTDPSTITIQVNGSDHEIPEAVSVTELLVGLGLAGQAVAVEVNRDLVPKRDHEARALKAGDQVELVTLVGGG